MPGFGDSKAWVFLDAIYDVAGSKNDFDVTALHPYARDINEFRSELNLFRTSIVNHGDAATPMWLTEWAWGSGPADQFGHNVGLTGQQTMLNNSVKLVLQQRTAWNIQRMYWFLWRDPEPGSFYAHLCSICGTAGLLKLTGRQSPPTAPSSPTRPTRSRPRCTSPPGLSAQPATRPRPSPSPRARSARRSNATTRANLSSAAPRPTPGRRRSRTAPTPSTSGNRHAAGNESAIITRQFVTDTMPPQTTITGGPAAGSSTADRTPTFTFSLQRGELDLPVPL